MKIEGAAGPGPLCRCLPVELAAATRLTLLVLRDPEDAKLDVAASALPRSLQQLRLTEARQQNYRVETKDAALPLIARDFGGMQLQSLQLAANERAQHSLPLG